MFILYEVYTVYAWYILTLTLTYTIIYWYLNIQVIMDFDLTITAPGSEQCHHMFETWVRDRAREAASAETLTSPLSLLSISGDRGRRESVVFFVLYVEARFTLDAIFDRPQVSVGVWWLSGSGLERLIGTFRGVTCFCLVLFFSGKCSQALWHRVLRCCWHRGGHIPYHGGTQ